MALDTISDAVLLAFPAATTRIDGPLSDGSSWLEIVLDDKWLMVEWHPELVYGVCRVVGTTGHDEDGGRVFAVEQDATDRVLELLAQ